MAIHSKCTWCLELAGSEWMVCANEVFVLPGWALIQCNLHTWSSCFPHCNEACMSSHSISNHLQLDCLFNSLYSPPTKKSSKHCIMIPLQGKAPSYKGPVMWKAFPCHVVVWSTYTILAGPPLNIKTVFPRYGDSHVKDKTVSPNYHLNQHWTLPIGQFCLLINQSIKNWIKDLENASKKKDIF